MADGDATIDRMIALLRAVPARVRECAPAVAGVVRDELQRTIAAGTSPDGKAWTPKKEGGGKPLATVAKSVHVAALGTRVFVSIKSHVGRHHLGRARGGVIRQVIPSGRTPKPMAAEIRKALARAFREHMGTP